MSAAIDVDHERASLPREDQRALIAMGAWAAGAALSHVFGVWIGIGTAAVTLGGAALLFDTDALARMATFRLRTLAAGVVTGIGMTALTYALYAPISGALPSVATDTARLYATFGVPSFATLALAFPVVIVCEDIVWRGVVQSALMRRVGRPASVLLCAAAYALAHAPVGSLPLVLACIGCGLCWSALRAWTGSLVGVVIAHLIWDVSLLLWPLTVVK